MVDADGDGLATPAELRGGTDPLAVDTDGDGFEDGPEVHRSDVLPGASPTRIDVYVEVDAVGDASLPADEAGRVVEEFAAAPVGPDGSAGIHLHVVRNQTELPDRGPVSVADRGPDYGSWVRLRSFAEDHRDYEGYGYHYLLVVPDVLDVPDARVVGEAGNGVLVVESVDGDGARGATFMHELGHSLGIDREDFEGIDSRRCALKAYPSVMNYNSPSDYYGYSAGEPFDDWAAIEADLYVPDRSRFDGSVGG